FDNVLIYAEHLSKQYGVPSPSVKPESPSTLVSPETFNPVEVMQAINKPYKSILTEEETAYATILSKQFNVPSSVIEPIQVPSNSVDPKTFDLGQALIAINDFTHDLTSNNLTIQSSLAKPIGAYIYNPPEFKIPEPAIPKFEPINTTTYKDEFFSNTFNSKPYKYLDNFSKNEVKILTKGICTSSDFHDVLDLFKNNDLPNVYEKMKQNLHMKPKSVTAIKLTNPLYTKSMNEEGPVFLEYNNGDKEIHLPVTQPKFIPFIKTNQQEYRDIVLNSFLPHEQAHANISKKYGHIEASEGLIGFNEHLANTMAKDSLGPSYIKAETSYQNMWVGSSEKSDMTENYGTYLKSKKLASEVPANIATVNILENPLLKKKTDNILNNTLGKLYHDEDLRENILKDAYGLSKIYQTEAFKITKLSKKDTILSNFKAKRILSDVEKNTFKFLEELK
ncbi:MAG: hypothetical protein Q8O03_02965, partial [Nanoarchaeota archaeon]|nr:hypothetical protein [Nanoarchaeota archaeon]